MHINSKNKSRNERRERIQTASNKPRQAEGAGGAHELGKAPPDEAASFPALTSDRQRPRGNRCVPDGCCHALHLWDPHRTPRQELTAPVRRLGNLSPKPHGVEPADSRTDQAGAPLAARRLPSPRPPGGARTYVARAPLCSSATWSSAGHLPNPRATREPANYPPTPAPEMERHDHGY